MCLFMSHCGQSNNGQCGQRSNGQLGQLVDVLGEDIGHLIILNEKGGVHCQY